MSAAQLCEMHKLIQVMQIPKYLSCWLVTEHSQSLKQMSFNTSIP